MRKKLAVVRGGGDLATGIVYRLWRAHFRVVCLETPAPLTVRRPVSVAQAVFDGAHTVEGMRAVLVDSPSRTGLFDEVEVVIDPEGTWILRLDADLLVDATMMKRYTGTHREMAPLVLAIGPGFSAPAQVHGVIETKRGHYLGRLITDGAAIPNTGVPGMEMGYTTERLLRAPADGYVVSVRSIGDHLEAGDLVARVGDCEVRSGIAGMLRGLIHPDVWSERGVKIGDVDPRDVREHCFSITDKALAIGGGVLEAVMYFDRAFGEGRKSASVFEERVAVAW